MLLMDYPSIRGEYLPYYSENVTWNLLYAYIDAHSQILMYEYPGGGLQDTSRLKTLNSTRIVYGTRGLYD